MSQAKVCLGIMPNPDVSSLGVSLILLCDVLLSYDSSKDSTWSLYHCFSAGGDSATAENASNHPNGAISLYHATLIYHMLVSLSGTVLPSAAVGKGSSSLRLIVFSMSSYLSYQAWSLHVWTTALTFGSQPECNHSTKFVFFWVTVRATAPWLRIWWIVTGATGLSYGLVIIAALALGYFCSSPSDHTSSTSCEVDLDADVLWATLGAASRLVIFIYTIKRNNVLPGENVWSFGQILSVVLLLGFCNDAIKWYNKEEESPPPSPATTPQLATSPGTTSNPSTPVPAAATGASGGDTTFKSVDDASAPVTATTPTPSTSPETAAKPSTSRSTSSTVIELRPLSADVPTATSQTIPTPPSAPRLYPAGRIPFRHRCDGDHDKA
ncbi:hypothetical protein BD410DRAFT_845163 [Rickenella mellea]|uniref:Uncharacterized protein n=1 Tax=Rickenella mellea TaxID=50990 RepID=A0A4Y7PJ18_9AGAM|nr:hypothetical protein BD410DRAFT_845163 [Rickenella mellea]